MSKILATIVAAVALLVSGTALTNAASPTDSQIAHIAYTAGAIDVGALSGAAATGAFNYTETSSGAAAFSAQGSNPAISTQTGAASGTAVAVGAGAGASAATSVSTSGSVNGTFTVTRSVSWSLAVLSGSISGGFTVVSGHTGAFILGSP